MRLPMLIALGALTTIGLPAITRADTLYYGGDPTAFQPGYYYESYNGVDNGYDERVYDNFTIPTGQTWTITGLFAQISDPNADRAPSADWQIYSGTSVNNLGTLIAGGTGTGTQVNLTSNGWNLNNSVGETLTLALSSPVVLAGGQTYWFSLAPDEGLTTTSHMFLGLSPGHANAVGSPLDNSSIFFGHGLPAGVPYPPQSSAYPEDASLGVLGQLGAPIAAAPLPATAWAGLALLGIVGAASLVGRHQTRPLRH